jgi:hypothetical protein
MVYLYIFCVSSDTTSLGNIITIKKQNILPIMNGMGMICKNSNPCHLANLAISSDGSISILADTIGSFSAKYISIYGIWLVNL